MDLDHVTKQTKKLISTAESFQKENPRPATREVGMGWGGSADLLEISRDLGERGRDGMTFPKLRSIYMSGVRAQGPTVGGASAKTGRLNSRLCPASFSHLGGPGAQPRAYPKGEMHQYCDLCLCDLGMVLVLSHSSHIFHIEPKSLPNMVSYNIA